GPAADRQYARACLAKVNEPTDFGEYVDLSLIVEMRKVDADPKKAEIISRVKAMRVAGTGIRQRIRTVRSDMDWNDSAKTLGMPELNDKSTTTRMYNAPIEGEIITTRGGTLYAGREAEFYFQPRWIGDAL